MCVHGALGTLGNNNEAQSESAQVRELKASPLFWVSAVAPKHALNSYPLAYIYIIYAESILVLIDTSCIKVIVCTFSELHTGTQSLQSFVLFFPEIALKWEHKIPDHAHTVDSRMLLSVPVMWTS